MIRGVRKISSSDLLSLTMSRRNRRPRNGRSPRNGTFSTPLFWELVYTPPMTIVSPSVTSTLALTSFLLIAGWPATEFPKSGSSLVTLTSMITRLSGVICGVTSSERAASFHSTFVWPSALTVE
ncbi:hypothetical protein D3C78_1056650 [compost metagenome]